MNKDTGIYIHIPFCISKCKYCDFLSYDNKTKIKASEANIDLYFKSLKAEIIASSKMPAANGRNITSIFFGGGTPSMVDSRYIVETLSAIYKCFSVDANAEITIECNPGTVTLEKLHNYKKCGINRISLGLQSANNSDLKIIGRIHTFEDFLDSFKLIKEAGFTNINIDLMSALPHQTIDSYVSSLKRAISLKPTHISAYSLILEEGTPLYEYVENHPLENFFPSEEDEREMYYETVDILKENGYIQYEISNFSKEGYLCRHNCLYWKRGEYFGFGLGASSYINGARYKNTSDFSIYVSDTSNPASLYTEYTPITGRDAMSEFMYLGLRFTDGVNSDAFQKEFGIPLYDVFGKEIDKLLSLKLLTTTSCGYKLTRYGIDVSNYALSFFV